MSYLTFDFAAFLSRPSLSFIYLTHSLTRFMLLISGMETVLLSRLIHSFAKGSKADHRKSGHQHHPVPYPSNPTAASAMNRAALLANPYPGFLPAFPGSNFNLFRNPVLMTGGQQDNGFPHSSFCLPSEAFGPFAAHFAANRRSVNLEGSDLRNSSPLNSD